MGFHLPLALNTSGILSVRAPLVRVQEGAAIANFQVGLLALLGLAGREAATCRWHLAPRKSCLLAR